MSVNKLEELVERVMVLRFAIAFLVAFVLRVAGNLLANLS